MGHTQSTGGAGEGGGREGRLEYGLYCGGGGVRGWTFCLSVALHGLMSTAELMGWSQLS